MGGYPRPLRRRRPAKDHKGSTIFPEATIKRIDAFVRPSPALRAACSKVQLVCAEDALRNLRQHAFTAVCGPGRAGVSWTVSQTFVDASLGYSCYWTYLWRCDHRRNMREATKYENFQIIAGQSDKRKVGILLPFQSSSTVRAGVTLESTY